MKRLVYWLVLGLFAATIIGRLIAREWWKAALLGVVAGLYIRANAADLPGKKP